jgi:AcrR family transcriptional regulator
MGRTNASQSTDTISVEPVRLARAERRDALLDAAAEFVNLGEVDFKMEAIAERAGVSRPLVYKHFSNRNELLAALYQRESALLHAELSAAVSAAETLEDNFRALIHGALRAQASRGSTFDAFRAAGLRTHERREEQRQRDRTTVRYFASRAVQEFGLESRQAKAAVGILLGAVDAVLTQWRSHPTVGYSAVLEDTYVTLVLGGLDRLAGSDGRPPRGTLRPLPRGH